MSVWVTVHSHTGEQTLIGVCYAPPNDHEAGIKLQRVYREACKNYTHCVILGDFNHGTINWATSEAEARDQDFLDNMQDCYLTQHIREPTRGDKILDLVFSSEQKMVGDVCILPPLANSDHNAISFKIAISSTVTTTAGDKIQDLNRADWEGIRNDLTGIKWRETLTEGSNVQ